MASENLRGTKIATSKRRCSLFKKAAELSTLCGARVAIVVISKKGKVSMFPDSDTVIHRYINRKNKEEFMNNEVAEESVDQSLSDQNLSLTLPAN
ncbi:hypothetical protein ERO13_D05G331880v2 [Gossypium hirsutum]|uniref:MADS-box domain-containing protein n=5 Tax=Gossypium TaxID=3633 RepID=A0A0D2UYG7_GOSRA|nr:hypothetical protein ES319_D05G359100v1 [Gossypium barbadense]KAG4149352.1 hypothetical protein ERO13_D05G331880v2 [Gossypium hirsutum]KJB61325.1 hypothetical protein B456_009G356100 [Gossypium raimondii]TYG71274.1 hypothetical protein ES288_D05G382400v1 [Gossypium darwinii]TYH74183.1 hypothetical protein ES332_D05G380300v1 [Gossypium tomentosum]TYI84522.1 hypothetical protein E1A91_D05G370300v1 [Gossypium mustelinum]